MHIKKKSQFLEQMQEEKVKASRLARDKALGIEVDDDKDENDEKKMVSLLHARFD